MPNTNINIPSVILSLVEKIKHQFCSYETALPIIERTITVIVLTFFSFISLNPSLALAYSDKVDPSIKTVRFVVPYGPVRSLLINDRIIEPSELVLRRGMRISAWASAYSPTVEETDANPFRTASGTTVHAGTMASNFLPLGTKVSFRGKQYTVEDRMNSRYNDQYVLDIWQPSQEAALSFGIQLITIEIISLP